MGGVRGRARGASISLVHPVVFLALRQPALGQTRSTARKIKADWSRQVPITPPFPTSDGVSERIETCKLRFALTAVSLAV